MSRQRLTLAASVRVGPIPDLRGLRESANEIIFGRIVPHNPLQRPTGDRERASARAITAIPPGREAPNYSKLANQTKDKSQRLSSADCITSTRALHSGRDFYALQHCGSAGNGELMVRITLPYQPHRPTAGHRPETSFP
jgi:hypothetical protein